MSWILYVLVGLASGVVSGMGIGGGAILIPALTLLMDIGQHKAQNINLLYFLPTALIAIMVHKKNDNIEKKGLLPLILWGVPGVVAGSLIAVKMEENHLRKGFAVFLLLMAIYEITKGYKSWKQQRLSV